MSFRSRLVVATAVAVAVAVALGSGITFLIVRNQLLGEVDDDLRGAVQRVVTITNRATGEPVGVDIAPVPIGAPSYYVQAVSSEGGVLLSPVTERPLLPVDTAIDVAAGREGEFFDDRRVGEFHLRVLTTSFGDGFALQIARPVNDIEEALSRLRLVLLAVSIAGVAVAAGLGFVVAGTAMSPVRRLTDATDHVSATSDLTRRIEVTGSDELSRLASSFNAMLEALEASLRSQRQLVADASHELRTPLTSLRTNIEVLARGVGLASDERERLLADVVSQLEELTLLVADVVELARGTEQNTEPEDLRLDEIVERAVQRARIHAPGVAFRTDLEPTLVRGVPSRLDRALGNLLDNAAKWSPQGGTVEVGVSAGEVVIRDHGPGIDEADLPFVFERFYRSPSARGMPGSGLGLAIVRQVAESHGGRVSAERAESGGTLFRLQLPEALRSV